MKIVFMGTPDFAVDTLKTLVESKHEVVGVITQPDKPKGRSGKLQLTPVKETALQYGIPVYQPEHARDPEFFQVLENLSPDVIVVVAFGQILPKTILQLPKYGCINVHASLLPKLRGAAPIQWSIINGDTESGVTIQQMDEGVDTGDILLMRKYTLDAKETGGSLFDRLASFGGSMVLEVLEQAEAGTLQPVPQNHEEHTRAKMLSKETGCIDFTQSALQIERLIRGLNPWPSAYTYLDDKMLKLWAAEVISAEQAAERGLDSAEPGTVLAVNKQDFVIQTGDGCLAVQEVQLAGKKRMDTEAFLRGYSLKKGTKFS
ncbi:MAG: methionyl-tRNA formyltransferase [Lachnospiraceae bacterium]|nr:methionyl-tRNA formyltransferase [Lachnospiraceae bacterium]